MKERIQISHSRVKEVRKESGVGRNSTWKRQ